ncbi:hypothetical protein DFH09DRAFT_1280859 [Mycena vulgaris]|nr:hypothetical protein DFH09DRAFT_1280859 [Mycena vulgaris]
MPEISSASNSSAPRILLREWKAIKPYLPKSISLPAFELVPRNRPRFTCLECGFVNFYNIPLCVWCATQGPECSVRAFERTMPRARTASAPPRVFWTPNELSLRSSGTKSHRPRGFPQPFLAPECAPQPTDIRISNTRCPKSTLIPSLCTPGRPETHTRSKSQPNALRIGHPSRPYYSALRKDSDGSSYATSPAPRPRPASVALLPSAAFQTHSSLDPPTLDSDEDAEIEGNTFAFVSPVAAAPYEPRVPQRTLSARISRRLVSPVSALHSISREAEMREALAALVRESNGYAHAAENPEAGVVASHLKKLRRALKGLVRRANEN